MRGDMQTTRSSIWQWPWSGLRLVSELTLHVMMRLG